MKKYLEFMADNGYHTPMEVLYGTMLLMLIAVCGWGLFLMIAATF